MTPYDPFRLPRPAAIGPFVRFRREGRGGALFDRIRPVAGHLRRRPKEEAP